jgi:hypothetical protein
MTDHEKFESLLHEAGISREQLAKELGMAYTSVTNQLAPSKKLPRWAKIVLFFESKKDKKN